MAKSKEKGRYIEVQKGPVSVKDQYSMAFRKEGEPLATDLKNNAGRRSGMTLTKHEPKR